MNSERCIVHHVGKQQGRCALDFKKSNAELGDGVVDNAFIVVYTLKYTLMKKCKQKQDLRQSGTGR